MPQPHQHPPSNPMPDMPGMQMGHEEHAAMPMSLIDMTLHHASAGTSAEPNSVPMHMMEWKHGAWSFGLHGIAFLIDQQQTSPRGYDKFFSANWIMPMAQRDLGRYGRLTFRTMLSLEPATITGRYYPELFQQGETAFGRSIADGQHPHDFFMELAALYDLKLGKRSLLSFYVAPRGEPAIGPAAYAHRVSASEDPLAPLGHHWQDSTHIADDVLTAGFTHRAVRVEVSGFHGREPDEFRWDLNQGALDSWAARLTVNPAANWSAQFSAARITSIEVQHPGEDQRRLTASVMYNRPFGAAGHRVSANNWASTLLWGRALNLATGQPTNAYLAESTLKLSGNAFWGRIENADRSSELLLGKTGTPPPGFTESPVGRVQAFTAGYDRELGHIPYLSTALGGQVSWYRVPAALRPVYGSDPVGVVIFLRVRPKGH